ncbi:hypothetical protein BRADI_1g77860v3 [Brachypodium distachyon]|uniref:Uncharacterized protein n=1 Tax=Brachypodium distachyon TaxID=15368 RepID=I1HAN3_BRADI|nr:hypothetical protein BRADI_1g77860v3 [Brachypodium distachyon]
MATQSFRFLLLPLLGPLLLLGAELTTVCHGRVTPVFAVEAATTAMAHDADSPPSNGHSSFHGSDHQEGAMASSSSSRKLAKVRGVVQFSSGHAMLRRHDGVSAESKRVVPQGPNPLHN